MAKINLDQLMQDIVHVSNQMSGLKMLLDQKKAIMAKYFQKSGERSIANDEATVYVQERTDISYNIEAILKRLPKELTSQFIEKSCSIPDWDAFVRFMKQKGVSAQELRPFVSISKQVDQQALSSLYEKGIVSISDLEGCYEATTRSSVCLKMKNVDREIPIVRGTK